VERLSNHALAHDLSLWEVVERASTIEGVPAVAQTGCRGLAAVIQKAREDLETGAASELVAKRIDTLVGLESDIIAGSTSDAVAARRRGNLHAFYRVLAKHDAEHRDKHTLAGFLRLLALRPQGDDEEPENVVTLSSMHSAKGLEQACVPGGHRRGSSHARTSRRLTSPQDIEEERRLPCGCYAGASGL
jgi:DNA helicase-2/ATP-dependent DNA helicase PcrA